jgi:hypothetical protein
MTIQFFVIAEVFVGAFLYNAYASPETQAEIL